MITQPRNASPGAPPRSRSPSAGAPTEGSSSLLSSLLLSSLELSDTKVHEPEIRNFVNDLFLDSSQDPAVDKSGHGAVPSGHLPVVTTVTTVTLGDR